MLPYFLAIYQPSTYTTDHSFSNPYLLRKHLLHNFVLNDHIIDFHCSKTVVGMPINKQAAAINIRCFYAFSAVVHLSASFPPKQFLFRVYVCENSCCSSSLSKSSKAIFQQVHIFLWSSLNSSCCIPPIIFCTRFRARSNCLRTLASVIPITLEIS